MGLKINKNLRAMGLDMAELYCAFELRYYYTRKVIDVFAQAYASKEAFEENIGNNFHVDGIQKHYQFQYDRAVDGVDIERFCHEKIREVLTTDVTEERMYSTIEDGKEKTEVKEVVVKEKFCEKEEISDDLAKLELIK